MKFSCLLLLAPLLLVISLSAQNRSLPTPAGGSPMIAGCPVFPPDNIWNTPVDKLPVDPHSSAYIQSIGEDKPVHPDFGSGTYQGAPMGIPFTVVPGNQKHVRIIFDYRNESDLSNYPIPPDAPIEGGARSKGDRHILIVDRDNCVLWEIYNARPQPDGTWKAGSGAIFDLTCNCMRPDGWTSADAAGLPILPGLVRYDEVAAGEIRHALRFTAPRTRNQAVWPARHAASKLTDPQLPPLGQRFRLKSSFSVSGFSPQVKVILIALQKYGMMVADNGSSWFISGTQDEHWNNTTLKELRKVTGSDFEAVDASGLSLSPNSARVRVQK
ncbi:MAG: hypothetical protein ABSB35_09005 [Bryobacteraceae bacterium]